LFNANDARKEVAWPIMKMTSQAGSCCLIFLRIFSTVSTIYNSPVALANNPNFSTVSYNYSPLSSLAIQGTALPNFFIAGIFFNFSRQPG